jgi:hypothetical protein
MSLGLRKLTQRILAAAFAIIAMILAGLLFAPNQTALLLSRPLLASTNITLQELQGLKVGIGQVSFERMTLIMERDSAVLTGARIDFQLSELFEGKLNAIAIEKTALQIMEPASAPLSSNSVVSPQQLAALFIQTSSFPFQQLDLNTIELSLGQHDINATLSLAVQPLALQFNAMAKRKGMGQETTPLSLSATFSQISKQVIDGNLSFQDNAEEFLRSDIRLSISDTGVELATQNVAQMPKLMNSLPEYFPVDSISSSSDSLSFAVQLSNNKSSADILNFDLTVTEQTPVINFTELTSGTGAELKVPILTPMAGNYNIDTQHFLLKISDFESTLAGDSAAGLATVDISFKDNSASCMTLSSCQIQTSVSTVSNIEFSAQDKLENLSAAGAIEISMTDSVLLMSSDKIALSIPSITSLDFKGAAKVNVTSIRFEQDLRRQTTIARADYSADQINIENNTVDVDNLTVSGALALENNTVKASAGLRLANQLTANTELSHDLINNKGHAEITLNDYSFSEITPLSKLLNLKQHKVELVSGTVSGHSELQWQQSAQGALEIEGPASILLSDISGYYDDLFFVGFTSAVDGEFVGPMNFRSARPLHGEISTLGIGIPVSDISWNYSWDYSWGYSSGGSSGDSLGNSSSNPSEYSQDPSKEYLPEALDEYSLVSIGNLAATVLGGEVSVPNLVFDSKNPQSESNVVISELNMETIVALADYPGLHVDGFISGYLPISITDYSVTLSDGLISALNPGGTISYKPTSPSPSSNSSLRLVNDALSDYRYDRLNTTVFYTPNGDLTLAVQLQGFNPSMNQGQAINLNVNVTDNIPTLLKSLQASRSITDALEETLNKQ